MNGSVVIKDAELKISPNKVSVTGYAAADYKVLWYKGTKEVRVDYSSNI